MKKWWLVDQVEHNKRHASDIVQNCTHTQTVLAGHRLYHMQE